MDKKEKASCFFREGYNCAQSVILAFHEDVNLNKETAAMLASSFGGGMGRLREVCGAVSAMFLIAGFLKGYKDPDDEESKAEHYKLIQAMAMEFKKKNRSIICRELLGLKEGPDDFVPEKRTENYYDSRPCDKLIKDAAEIIEQFLF